MRDEKIDRLIMFQSIALAYGGKPDDVRKFLRTLEVDNDG